MVQSDEIVVVKIPRELADRVAKKLSSIEFDSLADGIIYALEEYLTQAQSSSDNSSDPFSEKEQAAIERKLKDLGYG